MFGDKQSFFLAVLALEVKAHHFNFYHMTYLRCLSVGKAEKTLATFVCPFELKRVCFPVGCSDEQRWQTTYNTGCQGNTESADILHGAKC